MSALPSRPQKPDLHQPGVFPPLSFARMQVEDLAEVMAIENDVYPHPWTHGNFLDSLCSGYEMRVARMATGLLAGYYLLMLSVDEGHLLNITVRRELHGRGLGRQMLDHVVALAREREMQSILLEVRPSNDRALMVYERYGFAGIGVRRDYYPAGGTRREDAIVMRLAL
jgi:ribosomal-protein-alanine N-acetyltransferase